jgi:hypothetical protein
MGVGGALWACGIHAGVVGQWDRQQQGGRTTGGQPMTTKAKSKTKSKPAAPKPADVIPAEAQPTVEAPPAIDGSALPGKLRVIAFLLRNAKGATLDDLMFATGWQAHSIRGAISGALKKKHGLAITSEKTAKGRVYRIGSES